MAAVRSRAAKRGRLCGGDAKRKGAEVGPLVGGACGHGLVAGPRLHAGAAVTQWGRSYAYDIILILVGRCMAVNPESGCNLFMFT